MADFLPPYVGSYDPEVHYKDTETQIQRSRQRNHRPQREKQAQMNQQPANSKA